MGVSPFAGQNTLTPSRAEYPKIQQELNLKND